MTIDQAVVDVPVALQPAPEKARFHRFPSRIITAKAISVVVLLLIWEAISRLSHINPTALPAPDIVIRSWWDDLTHFHLLSNTGDTLEMVVLGFIIAAALGLVCGIAMGLARVFREIFDPYVTFLLTIPFTAVVPALVVVFSIGTSLKLVAAGLFAFPLVAVNTYAGVRTVDNSLVEMGKTFGLSGRRLVTKIIWPAALPSTIIGLQQGFSSAVKGVILAEILASYTGLGSMVVNFGSSFRSDHLLAVIFTLLVIVLVAEGIFTLVRRRLAPWSV